MVFLAVGLLKARPLACLISVFYTVTKAIYTLALLYVHLKPEDTAFYLHHCQVSLDLTAKTTPFLGDFSPLGLERKVMASKLKAL